MCPSREEVMIESSWNPSQQMGSLPISFDCPTISIAQRIEKAKADTGYIMPKNDAQDLP
jgi:hypothetical protein